MTVATNDYLTASAEGDAHLRKHLHAFTELFLLQRSKETENYVKSFTLLLSLPNVF